MSEKTQFHHGHLMVSEVMSQKPVNVTVGTPLVRVAELLADNRFQHVFVSETGGQIAGVVSSNDLLRFMAEWQDDENGGWRNKPVEAIMATKFVTSAPDASADDVAPMIAQGCIPCVPVVEGDKLVGVLTPDDLLLSWNRLDPTLRQASNDAVTNLPNRAMFDRRLEEEWDRACCGKTSFGLIIIDIDHFKQVNDTCGHLTGDAILQMVGACLRRQLRTYDVVARFAGDEFAALCCNCSPEDIDVPIRRLQEAIRKLSIPSDNGARTSVTLSIGAAVINRDYDCFDATQLLAAADKCLYLAKEEGRDRAFRVVLNADGDVASSAMPVGELAEIGAS